MEFNLDSNLIKEGDGGLSERLIDGSGNDGIVQHHEHDSFSSPTYGVDPEDQGRQQQIIVNQVLQGEKQPNQYRDAWAAALFVAHLIAVGYLGIAWGIPSLNYESTSASSGYTTKHHYGGIFGLCILSSIAALMITAGALAVVTHNAQHLIQYSLILSIVTDAFMVVYFISQRSTIGIIFSICFLLIAGWYASVVWRRIPFASANLESALTAVRTNGGLAFVAFGVTILINMVFVCLWLLAWLGVYVRFTAKDCQQKDDERSCYSHVNPFVVALFLLSYYWVSEVGKNIIHVTVSGVVGTWWFAPDEATTFFSPAISDSFVRATTFSAGSICLGSLLTASLQVLYHLSVQARRYGRGYSLLLCVLECISGFLERVVAYFNKWAYVYVGLYGYDYLTAGRKVMEIFNGRGWTMIINDDLVSRVLIIMSVVIGILTGCVSLVLAKLHPGLIIEFGSLGQIIAFLLPLFIGTSMSLIVMSVVSSAVDTVIVAFCEAPMEFERNHPGLHRQMTTAWSQIYPEEFGP